MAKPSKQKAPAPMKESSPNSDAESQFKPRIPVRHAQFGQGTVVSVEGDKLTIRFKTVGLKVVLESYVKVG